MKIVGVLQSEPILRYEIQPWSAFLFRIFTGESTVVITIYSNMVYKSKGYRRL